MAAVVIVESLGTSGSGKSSLISILTQLLRNENQLAMSATEAIHHYMRKTWIGRLVCFLFSPPLCDQILWRVFAYLYSPWSTLEFAVRHPQLIYFIVKVQLLRQIPWSHRILILRVYFIMAGWFQFFKHHIHQGEVIFMDEGFVHRAAHLFVSEAETPDPRQVIDYMQLLSPPDLVMWVRAPVDLCLSRVYARGVQVRLSNLSPSEAWKFLLNTEQVCQIAAEYIKNVGWPIVEVDNVDDPEVCAAQLCQAVVQHLS